MRRFPVAGTPARAAGLLGRKVGQDVGRGAGPYPQTGPHPRHWTAGHQAAPVQGLEPLVHDGRPGYQTRSICPLAAGGSARRTLTCAVQLGASNAWWSATRANVTSRPTWRAVWVLQPGRWLATTPATTARRNCPAHESTFRLGTTRRNPRVSLRSPVGGRRRGRLARRFFDGIRKAYRVSPGMRNGAVGGWRGAKRG